MAAQERDRKQTEPGMGAVRPSRRPPTVSGVDLASCSVPTRAEDAKNPVPLSLRDTLPAPPSRPVEAFDSPESGARRIPSGADVVRHETKLGLAPSVPPLSPLPTLPSPAAPSAPPISAAGRYFAQALHDDILPPPPSPRKSGKETLRHAPRNALRVDEVGSTTIVARRDAEKPPNPGPAPARSTSSRR